MSPVLHSKRRHTAILIVVLRHNVVREGGYCDTLRSSVGLLIRRPSSARVSYCIHSGDTDLLLLLLLLLLLAGTLSPPGSHHCFRCLE